MGVTLQDVTRTLDAGGFKYIDLDGEALFLGIQGDNLEAKVILYLDEEGEYLDMRAVEFARLRPDHPYLEGVLLKLASINYQYRVAKFGWDPEAGEIKAEASIPLEDNAALDKEQVTMFIGLFFSVCDEIWPELQGALEEGGFDPEEAAIAPQASPSHESKGEGKGKGNGLNIWTLLLAGAALAGVLYLVMR